MPQLIRTLNDVMTGRGKDAYFIRFKSGFTERSQKAYRASRKKHFDWFHQQGLQCEAIAPEGWLEGDPDCYLVEFNGSADSRLMTYSAAFETNEGQSLMPNSYQMGILLYHSWQSHFTGGN